jgi:hypothetical protein
MKSRWKPVTITLALLACLALLVSGIPAFADDGDGNGTGEGQGQPLTFVSSSPADGASSVSVDARIYVNFNKNVAYYLANRSHFSMKEQGGASVAISVRLIDDRDNASVRRRATIIPREPLKMNTGYVVTVTAGIMSKSGDTLGSGTQISFTTGSAASTRTPAPTKTASTAKAPSTPRPSVIATPTPSPAPSLLPSIIPSPSPAPSAGDGTGTKDGSNKGIPVELTASSVIDGQTDVAVDSQIKLTFSKNVVYMTVAAQNKTHFALLDAGGNAIPIEIIMADDQIEPDKKRDVIIQPSSPLAHSVTYELLISKGVQSKSGDSTQSDIRISFATAAEGLPAWPFIAGGAVLAAGVAAALIIILTRRKRSKKGAVDGQA